MRLQIVDPANEIVGEWTFDADPNQQGAAMISGFHGTKSYEFSKHDQNLVIRLVGIANFNEASESMVQGLMADLDDDVDESDVVAALVSDATKDLGQHRDDGSYPTADELARANQRAVRENREKEADERDNEDKDYGTLSLAGSPVQEPSDEAKEDATDRRVETEHALGSGENQPTDTDPDNQVTNNPVGKRTR